MNSWAPCTKWITTSNRPWKRPCLRWRGSSKPWSHAWLRRTAVLFGCRHQRPPGVVDASECPPTFGVPHGVVVGIMAGGDTAIRRAVEGAEDDEAQGWRDLETHNLTKHDTVVGIAASGRTPYVVGALNQARKHGLLTGCVTCNPDSLIVRACDHPVVAVTGPNS